MSLTRRGLFGVVAAAVANRRLRLVGAPRYEAYIRRPINVTLYAIEIPISVETMAWLKSGGRPR